MAKRKRISRDDQPLPDRNRDESESDNTQETHTVVRLQIEISWNQNTQVNSPAAP